ANSECVSWLSLLRLLNLGLGRFCLRASEPFVETYAADARFAQRHKRAFLDRAAIVSGIGVTLYLSRIADRLGIAAAELGERRPLRAGYLHDPVTRCCERHSGDECSNVIRRDGLEQAGRNPDNVSIRI